MMHPENWYATLNVEKYGGMIMSTWLDRELSIAGRVIIEENGKKKSNVNAGLCKGCGCCVAACPSGAMEKKGFKGNQNIAEIDACLDSVGGQ